MGPQGKRAGICNGSLYDAHIDGVSWPILDQGDKFAGGSGVVINTRTRRKPRQRGVVEWW